MDSSIKLLNYKDITKLLPICQVIFYYCVPLFNNVHTVTGGAANLYLRSWCQEPAK